MKLTARCVRIATSFLTVLLLVIASGGEMSTRVASQNEYLSSRAKKGVELPLAETSLITTAYSENVGQMTKSPVEQQGVPSAFVGAESEPNDTAATADPLPGNDVKMTGNIVPNGDVDFFSFTAAAGDRVSAAVMTSWDASASGNSILDVIGTDGTTILETDLDDGSFGATSSTIAGIVIAAPGTYFLRVRQNSATAQIRPYELYMAKRAGAPTSETELNDTTGTANPLAPSRWMAGVVNPAADVDYFSVALNAGDTVFLSLDIDPERDNVQWNGRLGFGLFGNPPANQVLITNDGSTGSATNPLSEAFFFTVKDTGTYYIYVDSAALGGATFTYNVTASIFPAVITMGCTTYASTDVPVTIPSGPSMVTSNLIVPATTERIRSVRVFLDITHTFMADLDIHLVSPANNDNGLVTDIGGSTVGGPQTVMNWWIDDSAALPPPFFALTTPFRTKPEPNYRLNWFNGENPSGAWQLVVRDDAAGDAGTINNWSLEICTAASAGGKLIYSENFDMTDGGFTHSGTQDEWMWGVPNTPATTTTNPIAPFLNCNNGSTGCWKTDLLSTYNPLSNQDLFSPNLNLTQYLGTIRLEWAMRFQMESANFDHAFVEVQDINNPANNRIVWQWLDGTMTNAVGSPVVNIGESAGWGVYTADISDFAGKLIRVRFHLDSDISVQLGGLAIDDVQLYQIGPTAANVSIGGRVLNSSGIPIPRVTVTLAGSDGVPRPAVTNAFGYYRFDDVETGQTFILSATSKTHTFLPRVITVHDEISDLDIIAKE